MSTNTPVVREVDTDNGEWNRFVAAHPAGTAFHRWEWKSIHANVFRNRTRFVVLERAGAICGVLPLVEVRSLVFGHFLMSMPYVNYGGPLVNAPEDAALLCDYAKIIGGAVDLVELRSSVPLVTDMTLSQRKVTVILDVVAGAPDETFGKFSSKLRSQIRRGEKDGLRIGFGSDQLDPFLAVFHRNMRDLGSPAHGRAFFQAIAEGFGDDVWIGCAYHNDVPVAAGIAFRYGEEVEITWASSLREYNRLSPNMALYWAFIRRASAEGASSFNFGRCSPDSGTHKFKLQWGGETQPLYWYQHSKSGVTHTPSPERGLFALATRTWQRIPVPVTSRLGPHIVKGIP